MEVIENGFDNCEDFWFLARNSGKKLRSTEKLSSKAISWLSPLIAWIPLILLAVAIATRKTVFSVNKRRDSLSRGSHISRKKAKTMRMSQPGQVFLCLAKDLFIPSSICVTIILVENFGLWTPLVKDMVRAMADLYPAMVVGDNFLTSKRNCKKSVNCGTEGWIGSTLCFWQYSNHTFQRRS